MGAWRCSRLVCVVTGVAGEDDGAAAVFEAIPAARLDDVAVVHLEGDHPHAILFIDHAVAVEFDHVRCDHG